VKGLANRCVFEHGATGALQRRISKSLFSKLLDDIHTNGEGGKLLDSTSCGMDTHVSTQWKSDPFCRASRISALEIARALTKRRLMDAVARPRASSLKQETSIVELKTVVEQKRSLDT